MIVVSGAGPVGLSCAYFIKKNYPREHVVIVEKRAAYSRKQVLLMRPDVIALLPKISDACFVFPPPSAMRIRLFFSVKKSKPDFVGCSHIDVQPPTQYGPEKSNLGFFPGMKSNECRHVT